MSPSEIAFLAVGLVLGAAIGAALLQVSGSHLAPRREVRLTITPNAIPARRAHTLAVPYDTAHPGIIPGSPDGDAFAGTWHAGPGAGTAPARTEPAGSQAIRTRVPSPAVVLPATVVAVPVGATATDRGRDGWPVMAAHAGLVAQRSRLESPGRDDPFTAPVIPRPAGDQGGHR